MLATDWILLIILFVLLAMMSFAYSLVNAYAEKKWPFGPMEGYRDRDSDSRSMVSGGRCPCSG